MIGVAARGLLSDGDYTGVQADTGLRKAYRLDRGKPHLHVWRTADRFSLPDMLYLSGCWTGQQHTVGQSCLLMKEERRLSAVYSEHVVRGSFIGLEASSPLKRR